MAWDTAGDETSARPANLITVTSSSILDDDASFLELLLVRPDLVDDSVVFVADGRGWCGTGEGWPLAVGWRREGGPVVLGVTTGSATDTLLIEPLHLAGATASWSVARWDEALGAWWEAAPPELRARVAERWGVSAPWGLAAWTRAAWGTVPAIGRAAVGVVATRLPESVRGAIEWLATGEAAAAFRIQWYGAQASTVPLIEAVAGGWTPRPGFTAPRPSAPVLGSDVPSRLVAAIEGIGAALGCEATRNAGWVRLAGSRRALRVFPGPAWVDVQLVGLDEGSLVGLRYRHGVPLGLEPPPGAPPGVHLRLLGTELAPHVEELLKAWLGEAGGEPAGGEPTASNGPSAVRPPRNARRRPE